MTVFEFEAVEADGTTATGTLVAATAEAAARQLQARGAVPLRIDVGATGTGPALRSRRTIAPERLARLARELSVMLAAGLKLDHALASVARTRDLRALAPSLTAVLEEVRAGSTLSDALARRPELMPPYATGMIRAWEAAGALGPVLGSLAVLAERRAKSARAVRAALTYPAILAATAMLSIAALFTVVLPQLEPLFAGAEDRLPAVTVIVIAASRLFREYGAWALGGLIAAGLAGRLALAMPETRRNLDGLLIRLPLAGSLIRRIEGGRFARLMSTLLRAGLSAPDALELARGAAVNGAFADALADVRAALIEGQGIAGPLAAGTVFPPVILDLARVGEDTGRLAEVMGHAADILEDEAEAEIQRNIALLGPLLTIGLGGLIAFVIAAVVLAILSMNAVVM
jgi:general secretion pathway protein F